MANAALMAATAAAAALTVSSPVNAAIASKTAFVQSVFVVDDGARSSLTSSMPCTRSTLLVPRQQQFDSAEQTSAARRKSPLSVSVTETEEAVNGETATGFPLKGDGGIWLIENKEQHELFLAAHPNELVVMKFFAPWCRACKGLAPKFVKLALDDKYKDLPVVFAEMSIQHNKDFVKTLGILALPSVTFYAGSDGMVENFPCGPSKFPILKKKLALFLNANVDRDTLQLKLHGDTEVLRETPATKELHIASPTATREVIGTASRVGDLVLSQDQYSVLRNQVPYFRDFTEKEFEMLLSKATLQTFEAGSVIMRQGMEGHAFYVIDSGEVEISVKAAFEDPLTTPSNYLGAVVNRFKKHEFFGERSLITGEPRAASIRAVEKTRCFKFKQEDIPESSVLSGKKAATPRRLQQIDDKYSLDFYDIDLLQEQFKNASIAAQARGSVHTPEPLPGLEIDENIALDERDEAESGMGSMARSDIIPLLVRFKLVRQAARCFEHIMRMKPRFGDPGEITRRKMLVSQLTAAQKEEFTDVFKMIDTSNDGLISVLELKGVMESAGSDRTDEELMDMINNANPAVDGNTEITFDEFMGVMAEAEFYYLFTDTFNALDKHNSGFVRAVDLDRVLCGMRDLISDDRKSIIDVEDKEMLVDYEQFSKMLLGASL